MCGCLRELDAVMTPLHKNRLLGWFYNDSCQYINGLQVRINIKKRILLAQSLFHAKGTRHTPKCSTGCDGFGTFVRLNRHLIDRICEHLANGQSLEKSSPDYEETLCNYGIIADEAA
jgi:hypothetical protein